MYVYYYFESVLGVVFSEKFILFVFVSVVNYSDCILCVFGKFCDKVGLENLIGDCVGGWYCVRGVWFEKSVDVGVVGYCNFINGIGCFCFNITIGGVC